jgi:hypothetical protein
MRPDRPGGLRSLLAQPTFVNKELYFKLGGSKIFALLDDADPLSRLAGPSARPQAGNLASFYHLNVLQYSRPHESAAVEADLLEVRAAHGARLPDLNVGRDVIPAEALARLAATLTDLWLVDSGSMRKVTLCTNLVKEVGPLPRDLAAALGADDVPAVVVAGNLSRARFLYGIEGYFKLLIEAGRVVERLVSATALRPRAGASLYAINAALRFNPDRYSSVALLSVPEGEP